ncbi:hypothetical protein XENTR_v10003685 [Xenopus tropicalis]|nr:hypothetical protein XENTR_v10003685 [Xenopus tropicalis]
MCEMSRGQSVCVSIVYVLCPRLMCVYLAHLCHYLCTDLFVLLPQSSHVLLCISQTPLLFPITISVKIITSFWHRQTNGFWMSKA